VPLYVVAANLTHGGRTIFNAGPLIPAVLASSAIPGIFPPVQIDQSYYADGGTVDGCSVETAVALGARRIFVLAIGYDTEGDGGTHWSDQHGSELPTAAHARHCSPAKTIQRASQIMGNYQIARALERVPEDIETHVISLSTGDESGTLSFRDIPAWIDRAYAAAHAQLAAIMHCPAGPRASQAMHRRSA
jgi:NTE family protein